jgi:hypothetical protein
VSRCKTCGHDADVPRNGADRCAAPVDCNCEHAARWMTVDVPPAPETVHARPSVPSAEKVHARVNEEWNKSAAAPAETREGECQTCDHTLTGTPFCTAAGCLCADHRGPTLSSAEEWRSVALELGAEVKRLNESATPSPAKLAEVAEEIAEDLAGRELDPEGEADQQWLREMTAVISPVLRRAFGPATPPREEGADDE